jgi:hypothetical protein
MIEKGILTSDLLDYIHNDIQQLNDQHVMDYLIELKNLYLLYHLLKMMKEIYSKFEYRFWIPSRKLTKIFDKLMNIAFKANRSKTKEHITTVFGPGPARFW